MASLTFCMTRLNFLALVVWLGFSGTGMAALCKEPWVCKPPEDVTALLQHQTVVEHRQLANLDTTAIAGPGAGPAKGAGVREHEAEKPGYATQPKSTLNAIPKLGFGPEVEFQGMLLEPAKSIPEASAETSVKPRLCDAADGKCEDEVALLQSLLKVTHRHDANSKDGEDEGTSLTLECSTEPKCAIDRCRGPSKRSQRSWDWAGGDYDHDHWQLWKSEELGRCMEKYKATNPRINVDPADMYVICQYSEAKSSCSCDVSKEAKGTAASDPEGPVARGAEIYQNVPSTEGGENLEHWMRKDINGISVWSSTTTVSGDGVSKLVEQILSKGGTQGTLISGTHGDFAGNSGFEEEGVLEPSFAKEDRAAVKAKYGDQVRTLSVSGFVAAAKASGSSGGMDKSMPTNIANALAGDPDFRPDFIVKAFCLSSTAGETIDEGIRQYAATMGKAPASALKKPAAEGPPASEDKEPKSSASLEGPSASGDKAPASDKDRPLKSALKKAGAEGPPASEDKEPKSSASLEGPSASGDKAPASDEDKPLKSALKKKF